jgi:hypothetical protein
MTLFKTLRAGFAALLLCAAASPALAIPATLTTNSDSYTNITTATTTTARSGPGILHAYCVNTVGTTLVLWDSLTASGAKIASITTTALGCFVMDVNFRIGLTAVTVGTGDITLLWNNGAVR